ERYEAGHIPGAVWLGWDLWSQPAPEHAGPVLAQPGYWGVQQDGTDLSTRLGVAGLRDDGSIVVYSGGLRSRGREGRIGWMLLYLGARSVAILDGGWDAWLAFGGQIENGHHAPRPGRFTMRLDGRRR